MPEPRTPKKSKKSAAGAQCEEADALLLTQSGVVLGMYSGCATTPSPQV